MDEYLRLIAAGIRPDCAADTVTWYKSKGDISGLQEYIEKLETQMEVSER